jgi:carbon monoxide dehydrogenase subunit G
MRIDVEVNVRAPKVLVWKLITDIEHAAERISGIEKVEILERPAQGLLGLKWRETRTLFGKTATEVMWVTDVQEGSHYATEARSHGAIYRTKTGVEDDPNGTRLWGQFEADAQSIGAKVMSTLLGFLIKGATRKALLKDLADVKAAAESGTGGEGRPA